MPKMDAVPEEEAREIELEIKREVAGVGSNISDTVRQMNEQYATTDTPQTITRQLKQGNIPYWKVRRIANVHGLELVWKKKETDNA